MPPDDATELLEVVHRARHRTRSRLAQLSWLPWVLFGVLSVVAAPLTWWFGLGFHSVYWALGAPAIMAVASWHDSRQASRAGLEGRLAPTVVAAAVIVVGAFGTGTTGGVLGWDTLAAAGPPLAVAAGLALFARIAGSIVLAGGAALVVAVTVGLLVAGADPRVISTSLLAVCGTVGVVVGLGFRTSARWMS